MEKSPAPRPSFKEAAMFDTAFIVAICVVVVVVLLHDKFARKTDDIPLVVVLAPLGAMLALLFVDWCLKNLHR